MQYIIFILFILGIGFLFSKWKGFEFTLVLFFSLFFLGLLIPVYGFINFSYIFYYILYN